MYVRMVIGEAVVPEQIQELHTLFKEEIQSGIGQQDGNVGANVMVEEGGNLMLILTHWTTRETCLAYHASRSYRQFVMKAQHLMVGNFVVKIFRME